MEPRWIWNATRNTHYFYDQDRDVLVFPDGSTIPRPPNVPKASFLQEPTPIASRQPSAQSSQNTARPTGSSANIPRSLPPPTQAYVSRHVDGPQESGSHAHLSHLGTRLNNLALGEAPHISLARADDGRRGVTSGRYANNPPVSGQGATMAVQNNAVARVHKKSYMDPTNQVQAIYANATDNQSSLITDPGLHGTGVRAHRALYGASSGREGDSERLFSDYKIRPHKFFSVGRVFIILWVEPAADATLITNSREKSDRPPDPGLATGRHGEAIYSKVRRFVVIRAGDYFCSALPISTYGKQGVGKNRVRKSDHGIIHTGSVAPEPLGAESPLQEEVGMRPRAIRVVPDRHVDQLDPMSRIDYAKVYTIQHNLKVKPFGEVHPGSKEALKTQFRNVWDGVMSRSARPTAGSSRGQTANSAPAVRQRAPRAQDEVDDGTSSSNDANESDTPTTSPEQARAVPSSRRGAQLPSRALRMATRQRRVNPGTSEDAARQALRTRDREDRATRASFNDMVKNGLAPDRALSTIINHWVKAGWTQDAAAHKIRDQLTRTQAAAAATAGDDEDSEDDDEEDDDDDDNDDNDDNDDDDDDDDESEEDDDNGEQEKRRKESRS
nr:hypothetical protein CFP56_31528 [Quercus suber]